jgi:hypothetical protein
MKKPGARLGMLQANAPQLVPRRPGQGGKKNRVIETDVPARLDRLPWSR